MRFAKRQRLLDRASFERVQQGAATVKASSRHFTVLVSRTEPPAAARLGVIASRRVGSAVLRSRAKRLVREFFRARAATFGAVDLVVIVKSGAHELTAAEAAAELTSALSRTKAVAT